MDLDGRLLGGIGVLVAVVEAGSFGRAAGALGLTQSGVSRAIARLEERLGVRVLHRGPRSLGLTDEGRRFYDEVLPLFAGIEDAAATAAGAAARVRGRLRVSVDPTFGQYVLAPRLDAFLAAYPDLAVELWVRERLGELDADGIDVAVRFGEPQPSSLVCRRLFDTRVLTCAAPAYLERRGTPRHPRELAGDRHQCILFRDPVTGRPYEWVFHRARPRAEVPVAVRGRLTVNDPGSLIAACVGGVGIIQVLDVIGRSLFADGRLVQILPGWAEERFPVYAYYRSRTLPTAKVRAFLDFVVGLTR